MQIPEVKLELFRYIDNLDSNKLLRIYEYLIVKNAEKSDFWTILNDWQKKMILKLV